MSTETINAVVVRGEDGGALQRAFGAFSPAVIREQINLVQTVMKDCMKDGEHYGKIPGCGEKPTLLKAGAEKLAFVFRLAPEFDINERDLGNGHREYRITCRLISINSGAVMGAGVGICSTLESKYRYRTGEGMDTGKLVPREYWNLKKADRMDEAKALIGGKGFTTRKVDGDWHIFEATGDKVENPDIADTYNTVLKMAKKRAQIDATLTATAASDIFTQDVEDFAEPVAARPAPAEQHETMPPRAAAPEAPARSESPADPPEHSDSANPVVWFGRCKDKHVSELTPREVAGVLDWARQTWTTPNAKQAELLNALTLAAGGDK